MFFCSTPCMSLPTFSELLASLHLSSNGEPDSEAGVAESHHSPPISPTNINTHNHTRSRSTSISSSGCIQTSTNHFPSTSPSIIISHSDPSHSIFNTHHHHHHHHHSTPATTPATTPVVATGTESNVRSRHSTTRSIIRFTPYLGASKSVHIRRNSLPDDLQEIAKPDLPHRPSTVSPRMSPSGLHHLEDVDVPKGSSSSSSFPPLPPSPPAPTTASKAIHIDIGNHPDVPISSFVRRKTPQSSPTLTSFRQKRRATSFSPVLLPTLLPGLPPPRCSSDMANLCDAVATKLSATDRPRMVGQRGTRLSSYRSFYIARTKIGAS